MPTENIQLKNSESKKPEIYCTTYKKGQILGRINFEHTGGLEAAVSDIKEYLREKNLKHIHTVPFLVNLKEVYGEDN